MSSMSSSLVSPAAVDGPGTITAVALTKSHGDRVVLDGVDLHVPAGRRVGIIGENGAGKSTLLRLLAGVDRPDAGDVEIVGSVGHLAQQPTLVGTVGQVMAQALAPMHAAVRDVETLSASIDSDPAAAALFADRLAWAQEHDAWDADRRASVALAAVGLARLDPDRPAARLSGGQRPAGAGRPAHRASGLPAAGRADQPLGRARDAAARGVPGRHARTCGGGQPRPGVPGPGLH